MGVLMEIEDDNVFYWEAIFTLSWDLRTGFIASTIRIQFNIYC